jgi:protein-L-isoaspartate O-methyltransferase
MTLRLCLTLALLAAALSACDMIERAPSRPESALEFPAADRPVPESGSGRYSNEVVRDSRGEATKVMDLANIRPGMTVADLGAGEGYYTVRLAERVGEDGRVLAQDIDRSVLERLGERVEREGLSNISIKLGKQDDPQLPIDSFDRIFLVHVYHQVSEPYAFLYRMWPALAEGGEVIVVEADRPTHAQGIPPPLLFCEFEAVGYHLVEYIEKPDIMGYFARFDRGGERPEPSEIERCGNG